MTGRPCRWRRSRRARARPVASVGPDTTTKRWSDVLVAVRGFAARDAAPRAWGGGSRAPTRPCSWRGARGSVSYMDASTSWPRSTGTRPPVTGCECSQRRTPRGEGVSERHRRQGRWTVRLADHLGQASERLDQRAVTHPPRQPVGSVGAHGDDDPPAGCARRSRRSAAPAFEHGRGLVLLTTMSATEVSCSSSSSPGSGRRVEAQRSLVPPDVRPHEGDPVARAARVRMGSPSGSPRAPRRRRGRRGTSTRAAPA